MTEVNATMERQTIVNPPELQSQIIDVEALSWQQTDFEGIEMKVLYADKTSGASTIMFRLAPGAMVPLHEHTALEQTYVLAGSLRDDEGEVTAGNYVWRPGGNKHIAHAPNGAVFISFFLKPNRFEQGERFFTDR